MASAKVQELLREVENMSDAGVASVCKEVIAEIARINDSLRKTMETIRDLADDHRDAAVADADYPLAVKWRDCYVIARDGLK